MLNRVVDVIRSATTVLVEFAIFCVIFNTVVRVLLGVTAP
jgi:hypothetical protein